ALAETDLHRADALHRDGAISQAELDGRRAAFDQAAALLDEARARLSGARAAVGVGEARVAQARAALQVAELNASYTTIKAPARGVVSRRTVEPGQMI